MVYSYETREEFIRVAEKNLNKLGLIKFVTLKKADLTKGIDEKEVDAILHQLEQRYYELYR